MRLSILVLAALAGFVAAAPAGAQSAQARTHLGGKSSGLVSLIAGAAPGQTSALIVQGSDGSAAGAFELPPGTALVVTDLVTTTNGVVAAGTTRGGLVNASAAQTSNPYFSFTSPAETYQSINLTGGAQNGADSANAVSSTSTATW